MSDQECKMSRWERWKMKNRAQNHNRHVFFLVHIPCLNKPSHPSLSYPQWVTFPPFILTIPISTLPSKWPWFFLCSDYPSQPEQTQPPPSLLPHHTVSGHCFFSLIWPSLTAWMHQITTIITADSPSLAPFFASPGQSCSSRWVPSAFFFFFFCVLTSPEPSLARLPFFCI